MRSNGRRAISMQGEAVADGKSPMLHQKEGNRWLGEALITILTYVNIKMKTT